MLFGWEPRGRWSTGCATGEGAESAGKWVGENSLVGELLLIPEEVGSRN